MINLLENTLKQEDLAGFKRIMANTVVNPHHREHLYKIAFMLQKESFIDLLENKVSLSKEKRVDFLIATIQNKTEIKNLKYLENIDDMLLMANFKLSGKNLVAYQNTEFLKNFVEKFPITTLMNFNRIILSSFESNKQNFIEYLAQKPLDAESLFYMGLCAIKFNKREVFSIVVGVALKNDENILEKIKVVKEKYVKNMRVKNHIAEKDDLNFFIDQSLIETFAKHLSEQLSIKKDEVIKPNKKMKI